jgi:DNA alkylation damage repair protein AlkB
MYSSDTTKNKNAFSLAEKQYRMRVLETIRVDAKTGRRRKRGTLVEEIDLSDAIDFFEFGHSESSSVMRVSEKEEEEKKRAKTCKKAKGGVEPRVWKLLDHPGAYYVENALDFREQRALIAHCVKRLPERPNKTNHWQRLGKPLPADLYRAAKAGLYLNEEENGWMELEKPPKRGDGMESRAARHLLRKLRWATVGAPFDWTKRVYEEERAPEVDERIKRACVKTLEIVFGKEAFVEKGEEKFFDGQVGLANFYAPGDTLNGHVDDAEMNLSKPIASLSLGLPAIFLLGQKSKALKPVTALIVRSGDAIVLSGESRTMFHGVPRVFSDGETLMSSSKTFRFPEALERAFTTSAEEDDDDEFLLNFAKRTRINLSLRDVR